ncbi:MAG: phospholipase D family protein [Lachnospiraceae bacterium]|nr:phospholipase D family protein [Lachnospiraceae bacterium]
MRHELLEYIVKNGLEYQAMNMVMFNDIGFCFMPVLYPTIIKENGLMSFCGGKKQYSLLSSKNSTYMVFAPELIDDEYRDEDFDKYISFVNKMCAHPEHLYGYTARHKDNVWGGYIYIKKSKEVGIEEIRNLIILDFLEQASINSIAELHKYIDNSFNIRAKKYDVNKVNLSQEMIENGVNDFTALGLLLDSKFINSLKKAEEDNETYVYTQYFARLIKAEEEVFKNRTMPINTSVIQIINLTTDRLYGVGFQTQFKEAIKIETDISKDVSIVNKNDKISDIIFNIILELNANSLEFYAATGYVYESGLSMLEPVYQALMWQCFAGKGYSKIELTIGALQNYNGIKKMNELNYATAERINNMIDKGYIDGVYTYPNAFYHGKFYYISNGELSYVITGSSNITESAYCSNYELDMLYRFERKDGVMSELEKSFVDWYIGFKKKCIMFDRLDSNLFPRNMNIDEIGKNKNDSLRRKITIPEERERYDLLMSYQPAKIDERTLKNKRDIRPFKGYIIFVYPQYNLTLLESFEFGNACYIFGTCNITKIENTLIGKTRENVKKSDLYLTHIEHNEKYAYILEEVIKSSSNETE